jgi:hypothetical protein
MTVNDELEIILTEEVIVYFKTGSQYLLILFRRVKGQGPSHLHPFHAL